MSNAFLDYTEEQMKTGDGKFEDILPDTYRLQLTDVSNYSLDRSDNYGAKFEFTIVGAVKHDQFVTRKIWLRGGLEGSTFQYLIGQLIVAWILRNPKLESSLSAFPVMPDSPKDAPIMPEGQEQVWHDYLKSAIDGELDILARIYIDSKQTTENKAQYGPDYKLSIPKGEGQLADKEKEEIPTA